jgi:hypothetical protein
MRQKPFQLIGLVLTLSLAILACSTIAGEPSIANVATPKSQTIVTSAPQTTSAPLITSPVERPTQQSENLATQAGSPGNIIHEWATSSSASSEYGNPDWSAQQATGAPDTQICGDIYTAWASSASDSIEWLELRYDVPVHPTMVNIVQTYNPSQVSKVEVIDTTGIYHEIYNGNPQGTTCPFTLSIPVGGANYLAIGVKVTIDQSLMGLSWNEIDAVELVGSE